jgi:lysophospholipase L1-like esterase
MAMKHRLLAGLGIAAASIGAASPRPVEGVDAATPGLRALPTEVGGRVVRQSDGFLRQWPGIYLETAFRGSAALFRVGAGNVALHVLVDGHTVDTLVKPAPGLYRVGGLARGRHVLRLEVASESQAAPTTIGPFYAERGTVAATLPTRARRIEFIGDSHTVGYGVTSAKRECSQDEVWATTDTSRGFGARLAHRYGADYRINAISGRGVVRNYNGFAAAKLPQAYPFALLDGPVRADDAGWHPQVIVIALGTNDFTTALHPGEQWANRDALHADFEATYVRFVRSLRARDPHALVVLWATDMADGEIEAEVARVVATLRASGERRLAYVPVNGLSFTGCHAHPSLADQAVIADRIVKTIDGEAKAWTR